MKMCFTNEGHVGVPIKLSSGEYHVRHSCLSHEHCVLCHVINSFFSKVKSSEFKMSSNFSLEAEENNKKIIKYEH